MKLKILIISKYFYPQNAPRAFRTTELVEEFARQGHMVTLLTSLNKENEKFAKSKNFDIVDLGKPIFSDINIRGNKINKFIRRIFRRLLNIIFEFPNIEYFLKHLRKLKSLRIMIY